MPGRGQPWKGVGKGNPDRIGSGAIKDGSITEADLNSSVTAKLNSGSGYDIVEEEGSPLTQRSELNFVGDGVVASDDGEKTVVTITQATPDGVGYDEVQDEGTPLTKRSNLNFVGAGVVASDGVEDTTTITIAGGGGGSGLVPDLDTIAFFDEFMYNNPENDTNWFETTRYFIGGTNAVVVQPSGSDIGGLIGIKTDPVINRNATLMSGDDANSSSAKISFNRDLTMEFAFRVSNLSDVILLVGGVETPADDGSTIALAEAGFSSGAYFAFDDNANANWLCRNNNGGSITSVDSGVSVGNQTYKFKIVYDDGAGTMTYFIDGSQVAQISTNLPTDKCHLACSVNTKTASSNQVDLDYWGFTTARLASEP